MVQNKKAIYVVYLIFAGLALFCICKGILGLVGERVTLDEAFSTGLKGGEIVSGIPAYGSNHYNLAIDNSINTVPLGMEYYYMILSEDQQKAFVVRGPKNFGDNFDEDNKNFRNITIKGKVKQANEEVRRTFGYNLGTVDRFSLEYFYIDLTNTWLCILWLTAGMLNILIFVTIVVHTNEFGSDGTRIILTFASLIAVIVAGILLAYLYMQ